MLIKSSGKIHRKSLDKETSVAGEGENSDGLDKETLVDGPRKLMVLTRKLQLMETGRKL